jgi:hypothetical protein
MANQMRFNLILVSLVLAFSAIKTEGQVRLETIRYKTGRTVTGEIIEVKESRFLLARKVGKGSIREQIPFDRILPASLYSNLVSALKPLDRRAHKRIGDAAYAAELFPTAKRHYIKSATDPKKLSPFLVDLVAKCEAQDIKKLLFRSTEEMLKEKFKMSRKLALLAMKRYPSHEAAKAIPDHLERIKRRYVSARARDKAVAKTRKEQSEWIVAEAALDKLDGYITKAKRFEVKALRASTKMRRAKNYVELGLRELVRADKQLLRQRQSKLIPVPLKQRLITIDDEVLAMHIRLRLHIASLYSVRGSFGTALSWANDALSFDPTDPTALAARARIETSAAAASSRGPRINR